MRTQPATHPTTEPVGPAIRPQAARTVALAIGAVAFVAFRVSAAFMPAPHPSDGVPAFMAEAVDDAGALSLNAWFGLMSAVAFAVFASGIAGRLWRSGRVSAAFLALTGAAVASAASSVGYGARWVLARRAENDGSLSEAYVLSLYDLGSVTNYLTPIGFALVALAVGAAAVSSTQARSSWFAWPTITLAAMLAIPFGDAAFFALWLFFLWILMVPVITRRTL